MHLRRPHPQALGTLLIDGCIETSLGIILRGYTCTKEKARERETTVQLHLLDERNLTRGEQLEATSYRQAE